MLLSTPDPKTPRLPRLFGTGLLIVFAALAIEATANASPESPASKSGHTQPELKKAPWNKMSLSLGAPHDGSQVRAKKVKSGPSLKLLRRQSDATFGHPSLVQMLDKSAKHVAHVFPGSKLVIGDLSKKEGGPIKGHHSHQSGRDADVLFYVRDAKGKSVPAKKFVAFGGNGKANDGSGLVFDDERNWLLVESWARDKRAEVQYIFVSNPLKMRLIAFAEGHEKYRERAKDVAQFFMQPDNAEPHDDHFHVRIHCPAKEAKLCTE